jgi:hypothetical protein
MAVPESAVLGIHACRIPGCHVVWGHVIASAAALASVQYHLSIMAI